MSQPEEDLTRQVRRHRGPILGFGIVVLIVLGFFLWWVGYEVDQSAPDNTPDQAGETAAPPASAAPPAQAPDQPGGAPAPGSKVP